MYTTGDARRWAIAALAGVALSGALTACGDDDAGSVAAATPTTASALTPTDFLASLEAECPEFQPAFDEFYSDHPDPTTADYAGFLPTQIEGLDAMARCIEDHEAPTAIATEVQAVTAAMDAVIADIQNALDAARAGDADSTDEWLGRMHDVDVAKIDEAFRAVMAKADA
jgi:hypothetical protein